MEKVTVFLAGYTYSHPKGEKLDSTAFYRWLKEIIKIIYWADYEVAELYTDVDLTQRFNRFCVVTDDLLLFPKLK